MTKQTNFIMSLGGSLSGRSVSRICTLALAAMFMAGGVIAGTAQTQADAAKPTPSTLPEKKAAAPASEKIAHGYLVHQSIELGGRLTSTDGSKAMWDTMVNQSTGMRVLEQSLELHSVDTSKTHFFDTLSTFSTGYGGDPYDVSRLNVSKGRIYDFAGSFRRDRNFFDYNLFVNSLLTSATAATPALVAEPDSLHAYNTVRRNSDGLLTLMPLSVVSIRAGMNHGTHEGPSFSSIHAGGDTQTAEWFRNGVDTYSGGVDVKLFKRTMLSYDQFYVAYKGDTSFQMAATPFKLSDGTPVSLGVDVLTGAATTCGSGANKTENVINGVANAYCSGTVSETSAMPIRTRFPTEQVRFSSHYFDKVSFNGRALYSGATSSVNHFGQVFNGLNTRTFTRQEIMSGGQSNGGLATNKRDNTSADFGVVAEASKYFGFSESISLWDVRTTGNSILSTQTWANNPSNTAAQNSSISMLTPLSSNLVKETTTSATNSGFLDQKYITNTMMVMSNITPQFKVSGGWRIRNREISDPHVTQLTWNENGVILGAVLQPSSILRVNVNYDGTSMKYSSGGAVFAETATPLGIATPANTFTRAMPDKTTHFRARAALKPAKWLNFSIATNDYSGKNNDPTVNHTEHSHDISMSATVIPMEGMSLDLSYAHDDVFSQTNLCYLFAANANAVVPNPSAASAGTCLQSVSNPEGTLPTAAVASQLYLGSGKYDSPTNFFAGTFHYAPAKYFSFDGGARVNSVNGTGETLNPYLVPGALQSSYITPFADLVIHVAPQWAWHGNWMHNAYHETGAQNALLPTRDFHGDSLTLGVKYAF